MKMFFLLLALMLTLGFTSCTPEEVVTDETNAELMSSSYSDPPAEEAGEEEELEPND